MNINTNYLMKADVADHYDRIDEGKDSHDDCGVYEGHEVELCRYLKANRKLTDLLKEELDIKDPGDIF